MQKKYHGETKRLTIVCSEEQAEIVGKAVERDQAPDRNAWLLANVMVAATKSQGLIVLSDEQAARARKRAAEQGVTPEQLLTQLLLTA